MERVSVIERLPYKGFGSSYMTLVTVPVILFGAWREDYPIIGHFVLQTYNDSPGCNVEIPFEHPAGYKFYSARCAYIYDLSVLRSDWKDKLPIALTKAVTHWLPIP